MNFFHEGLLSNPYAAPEAVVGEPFVDESDWAQVLRFQNRKQEISIKHLSWLNFLAFLLFAPYTALVIGMTIQVVITNQAALRSRSMLLAVLLELFFMIFATLNLWIWYALRRFSPWAWRLNRLLAVVGLIASLGVLVVGFWLEAPSGSPIFVALLVAFPSLMILRVLSTKQVRRLFDHDYQQAITQTRQKTSSKH